MPFVKYVNPAATADIILENDSGEVLLIRRGEEPYVGKWALPGGHIEYGVETLEECVARELKEETDVEVEVDDLTLLDNYSKPGRDPRGHYITHVYFAKKFKGIPKANDDAMDARWWSLSDLPELAFDHADILRDYRAR